jgi:hypothetical protein
LDLREREREREKVTRTENMIQGELHDLYCSPNIIRLNWRRMRYVGHETNLKKIRNAYTTPLNTKVSARNHLVDLSVDRRIILKWT